MHEQARGEGPGETKPAKRRRLIKATNPLHQRRETIHKTSHPLAPAQGNIIEDVDRVCNPREVPGVPRGQPWGRVIDDRPMFVLARTYGRGVLKAITVTCNLHRHSGGRCNKSLSLGTHFSEEEAMRRIKAWCVAGLTLPNEDGSRQKHMDPAFYNPRTVPEGELKSIDELDALVGA